jgi:hypothetical protein
MSISFFGGEHTTSIENETQSSIHAGVALRPTPVSVSVAMAPSVMRMMPGWL